MQICEWLKREFRLTCDVQSCVLAHGASKTPLHPSCFIPHFSAFLRPALRCSSPSQTTPTARPLTRIRSTSCAISLEGRQSGYVLQDNSGAYAVFTEQGSFASQMTAAKIIDVIARLPGCDGQAADAVSANSRVKLEEAPRLLKIPNSECPDAWIRLPNHKWPKSWSSMADPVVPLERNLYGPP